MLTACIGRKSYNFLSGFFITNEILGFIHDFTGESWVALHSCKVLFNFFFKKKKKRERERVVVFFPRNNFIMIGHRSFLHWFSSFLFYSSIIVIIPEKNEVHSLLYFSENLGITEKDLIHLSSKTDLLLNLQLLHLNKSNPFRIFQQHA